jgi:hypothetical protein
MEDALNTSVVNAERVLLLLRRLSPRERLRAWSKSCGTGGRIAGCLCGV